MSRPSEAVIEQTVCDYAASRGYVERKMKYVGRRNCPDRFFFGPNATLVIIEFKKGGEPPNAGQKREHDLLRGRGFKINVIDDIEDGKALFD